MNSKTLYNVYYCMVCSRTYHALPQDGECLNCHQKRMRFVDKLVVDNPHPVQIIKIHSADIITSIRRGNIWFQSPRTFHDYLGDGKTARADIHDAKYSYISKSGYVDDGNIETYRILCFYSLDIDNDGNFITQPSDGLREFGGSYSIVDLETLLVRVKDYIINSNRPIDYVAHWVNYLGQNYSGVYSPFCKFPEFSYQSEFRVVLLSNEFIPLGKEPYKTIPPIENLDNVFSEPRPLDKLLRARNINDF